MPRSSPRQAVARRRGRALHDHEHSGLHRPRSERHARLRDRLGRYDLGRYRHGDRRFRGQPDGSATGLVRWQPRLRDRGVYTVSVRLDDRKGGIVTSTLPSDRQRLGLPRERQLRRERRRRAECLRRQRRARGRFGGPIPLESTVVTAPTRGTLTLGSTAPSPTSPSRISAGTDSFTYLAGDEQATVTITVHP